MNTCSHQVPLFHQSLTGRFEAVASKFRLSEAICDDSESCSYGELEQRSRSLARRIVVEIGSDPRPVAILIRNKLHGIEAILAVIRAGHFYCALSHRDPIMRLEKVLQDLEPCLLIVDESSRLLAEKVVREECRIMVAEDLGDMSVPDLGIQGKPESLLGVFYTSGSTGEPKGVVRRHAHVLHRLKVDIDDFGIGTGDRLLFLKRLDVTSSLWQIFGVLLTGATLRVCEVEETGIAPLAGLIRDENITLFPPPIELLRTFLDVLSADEQFGSIRNVILGGDVLFKRDVERIRCHIPIQARVIHHLSSSESGLLARTILHHDSDIEGSIVPVGNPVSGKEILLLDENSEAADEDRSGHIAVRTDLAFAEYWRRPVESASRFSPDPDQPGKEVFRTGDLGRFRRDGQLLFLGRSDFRVKIRGFTVDCSSVEGALSALPHVKRAVVVPVEKGPDLKQLVAYVVPSADEGFSPAEARIKLSAILPDYMLPQRFVVLDELPRTVSGKIDRSALSKLEQMHEELHVPSGGANNALEWGLQQIWEELLNVRPVGVWDDFFELGGHSLLAIRMMDKVEQTIGVRCQASALLRTPTIKGLAQAILEDRLSHLTSPLIHLRSEGHKTPFYYLHGDYSGGGLYCMNIVKHLESDRPFIVIPSHGLSEEPPTTIEEMAADRLQVILAHQKEGPFLLGGYCHGGLIAFEMARQMEQRGLKVDLLLLVDSVGERVPHRIIQGLFRLYGAMHGLSKQDCQALGIRALVELVQLEREGRWPSLRNTRGLLERVNAIKKRVRWLKRILRHLRKEGLSLPAFPDAPSRTSIAYREGYLRSIYKRAVRGYEAHSYTGKVIVLRSSATDERFPGDPTIGWGKVAGTVEPRLIPGDHMTCLTEHVVVLAKTIDEFLRKTDEPSLSQ